LLAFLLVNFLQHRGERTDQILGPFHLFSSDDASSVIVALATCHPESPRRVSGFALVNPELKKAGVRDLLFALGSLLFPGAS